MSHLKPFLDDMLSMSTGDDGRTLKIHFNRPVTKEDRQAFADAHNAIVRGQINGCQPIDTAPLSGSFLAETKGGDWIQVERYDNPHGFKNTVIDNRTGRWWTPARWMPLPPTNVANGASE